MVVTSGERGFSLIEMLMVVAIIGVLASVALPITGNALRYAKISGDARDLSNAAAVAKMRAASKFTQVRLFADLTAGSYYMQTCNTPTAGVPCPAWTTEGGSTLLSNTVSFGYSPAGTAPTNTQTTIQHVQCYNTASPAVQVANTACVIFNSRGLPVTAQGAPTNNYAIYINDGSFIYGVTVAATGFIRTWRTLYSATPSWSLQ
jgi:prepilin-type N-terminal cleavage/methylation domain-containing protein